MYAALTFPEKMHFELFLVPSLVFFIFIITWVFLFVVLIFFFFQELLISRTKSPKRQHFGVSKLTVLRQISAFHNLERMVGE